LNGISYKIEINITIKKSYILQLYDSFMTTEHSPNHGDHKSIDGFLDDNKIEELLKYGFDKSKSSPRDRHAPDRQKNLELIQKWYVHGIDDEKVYGHHDPIGEGRLTCDTAVAHYMDWIARNVKSTSSFTNPGSYSDENKFLFKENGTTLYFATVSPFHDPPDFRDINLTQPNDGLLIATFMSMESPQFYPLVTYSEEELLNFVLQDTAGIYKIEAYFDDEPINGCTVIRNKFQATSHVPPDNIMNVKPENLKSQNTLDQIYLWQGLALRPEFINQGDHLLEIKVHSKNYKISADIQISGMVGVKKT
jgi:hypothetical protein